ncbi:Man1-Src1p-C-terminal domain-containing protein [Lipomyces oligophaga]|uniref:Man1-Src1p-C-terminal domain-containing protein n=1 Tax=Lipomyces oligophaga TaxID=45792 RepID=UPI0034CF3EA7
MDDLSYLEPGFEPSTLRVADLRRILLFHEIYFPSSAKKAMLVDLFETHITPNSSTLRQSLITSQGAVPEILDAHIQSVTGIDSDLKPLAQTPRRQRASSPRKPRSTRRVPDTNEPKEIKEEIVNKDDDEGSPFSSKNPFQSPRPELNTKTKSTSKSSSKLKARLPEIGVDSTETPSRQSNLFNPEIFDKLDYPESDQRDFEVDQNPFDEQDEERNEEENGELSDSIEEDGENADEEEFDVSHLDGSRDTRPLSVPIQLFTTWICFICLVFYVSWFCRERFRIGYCEIAGLGRLVEPERHGLAWRLNPSCVACPEHAQCHPHFVAVCDADYLRVESLFSFNGWLPIAPTCVPDTLKLQRSRILMNEALIVLRRKFAEKECTSTDSLDPTMSITDLHDRLYSMKSATLLDDAFEQLWTLMYNDLESQEEIYFTMDHERIGSMASDEFPFSCVLRLQAGEFITANLTKLVSIALVLVASGILYFNVSQMRTRQVRVKQLSKQSLDLLIDQQSKSDADSTGRTTRFIVMSQLKDKLLSDEIEDAGERRRLWQSVQKKVEANANVRSRQMEIHGEIMRIWEYTGI